TPVTSRGSATRATAAIWHRPLPTEPPHFYALPAAPTALDARSQRRRRVAAQRAPDLAPRLGEIDQGSLLLLAATDRVGPLRLDLEGAGREVDARLVVVVALVGDLLAVLVVPGIEVRVGDGFHDLVGDAVGARHRRLRVRVAAEVDLRERRARRQQCLVWHV